MFYLSGLQIIVLLRLVIVSIRVSVCFPLSLADKMLGDYTAAVAAGIVKKGHPS